MREPKVPGRDWHHWSIYGLLYMLYDLEVLDGYEEIWHIMPQVWEEKMRKAQQK